MEQYISSVQTMRELWEEQDLIVTGTACGRAPLRIHFHFKTRLFPPSCEIQELMYMLKR